MDKLYVNGPILTMEREKPEQALLVCGGRIEAVGSRAQVEERCRPHTQTVDLEGRALLPAFIDPHSHLTAVAATLRYVSLEGARSFDDIVARLTRFRQERNVSPDQWLIGFGYDHNQLREKRHPDRRVLDRAAEDGPVLISHASGHMGVVSTQGLVRLGLAADTPDPEGGRLGRGEDGSLDGYLEETAFISASANMPPPRQEESDCLLEEAQRLYLRHGITTVQDGLTKEEEWTLLSSAAQRAKLLVDTVCYPAMKECAHLVTEHPEYQSYRGRLRIGGYKIILDGSPQGRTAWLSQPYEGEQDGYRGYPALTDAEAEGYIRRAVEEGAQLLAHCNGDAAAEQLIGLMEKAVAGGMTPRRPVMIHAQTVRRDQLSRMAALQMIPSFFIAHIHYWGDIHVKNLGLERAGRISPARSAGEAGLRYTFHQDSPVVPPDIPLTLSCAVNRRTASGRLLGQEEQITPYEALRAVTINAAYQYFEEKEKGSLAQGKRADLVILDRDPLSVPAEELDRLKILETIKDGETVYRA